MNTLQHAEKQQADPRPDDDDQPNVRLNPIDITENGAREDLAH